MLGNINEEVPKHVDEAHNKVNHLKVVSKSATAELASTKAMPKKESPKMVLNGSNNQPSSLNKKANNGPQFVTNNKERPPQTSYVAPTTVNAGMSHFFYNFHGFIVVYSQLFHFRFK